MHCGRCLVLCCSCLCVLCVILTTSCLLQEVYSTFICYQITSFAQQSGGWFWSQSSPPDPPCEMIYSAPSQDASGSPLTVLHQRLSAWILYFNPHGNDLSNSPIHLYLYDWLTYIIPPHTDASSSPVAMVHEHVYDWIFNRTNEIETCIKTNRLLQEQTTGFSFQAFVVRGIVIAFSSVIVIVLSLMITICICFLLCKRSRNEKVELTAKQQKDKQRIEQELEERRIALHAVKSEVEDTGTDNTAQGPNQEKVEVLPECGCRLQKYWFKQGNDIITTTPVSKKCTIDLKNDIEDVRSFLRKLEHKFLQPISDVKYMVKEDKAAEMMEQVVVTQPFRKRGSIRDIMHKADPVCDCAVKYKVGGGIALSPEEVAKYGKQVLDAMLYLYKQNYKNMLKLSPLGHVHNGNIFVEGGVCRLGGYENTLLGYRTRLYRLVERTGCLENIDVIMFGHVIYEMSTGKELEELVPSPKDINIVRDEGCRKILKFIFKKRSNNTLMQHSIQKIRGHEFFTTDKGESREKHRARSESPARNGQLTLNDDRNESSSGSNSRKQQDGDKAEENVSPVRNDQSLASNDGTKPNESHINGSSWSHSRGSQMEDGVRPRGKSFALPSAYRVRLARGESRGKCSRNESSRASPQESNGGESREKRWARSESSSRASPQESDRGGSREKRWARNESSSASPQESNRGGSREKRRARSESSFRASPQESDRGGSREKRRARSESSFRASPQESDRGGSREKRRARSESSSRTGLNESHINGRGSVSNETKPGRERSSSLIEIRASVTKDSSSEQLLRRSTQSLISIESDGVQYNIEAAAGTFQFSVRPASGPDKPNKSCPEGGPSRRDVRLALQGITKEWDDLAEALGLPYSDIDAIKTNNPSDVKQCVKEVVDQWFKGKGSESPSWTSLCTALRDPLVNREDIASKIEYSAH